jgi:hypothetical protein
MSSGSQLTLHNCEIYYLSAVTLRQEIYYILSGSLFTLRPYPKILAEVTIYPARFTAFFGLYQDHYSHYRTLGFWYDLPGKVYVQATVCKFADFLQ